MIQHASETSAAANVHARPLSPARAGRAVQNRPSRPARRTLGWYDRCKFSLVRRIVWGWTRMFSLKGLYLLGVWFATIEYLIDFKRRGRYMRQLRRVFQNDISLRRQKRITLSYFRRMRCDKLYYLIFDRLPRDKIMRRIKFKGREYLDAALERGDGVYVMLSHNGSHHVAGGLMALLGYQCAGVRDPNEGAIRIYMREQYSKNFPEFDSIRVLYADAFPREIFRCFQENRVVGTALDVGRVRGVALKTCSVRIFGESREFLTGTLQVALRCRSTVVQAFVVSRRNFYYRLIVKPPLLIPDDGAEAPKIPELMQRYADGIEAHVHEYPDHLSRP